MSLNQIANAVIKEAEYERAMKHRCPLCGAGVGERCRSLRSGARRSERSEPHWYRSGVTDASGAPPAGLDFQDDTKTIREWIAGGAVNNTKLVAELGAWMQHFAGGPVAVPIPVAEPGAPTEPTGVRRVPAEPGVDTSHPDDHGIIQW